jgi:hypothetical protein
MNMNKKLLRLDNLSCKMNQACSLLSAVTDAMLEGASDRIVYADGIALLDGIFRDIQSGLDKTVSSLMQDNRKGKT